MKLEKDDLKDGNSKVYSIVFSQMDDCNFMFSLCYIIT